MCHAYNILLKHNVIMAECKHDAAKMGKQLSVSLLLLSVSYKLQRNIDIKKATALSRGIGCFFKINL